MKIWFDLSNSPHINFFASIIRDLKPNHEIIITCRPLANTIDLLELHKFDYQTVGIHYGKNFLKKLFGYPVRVWQLYCYLRKLKPDVAISHSSFHSPITAKMLGCRSVYLNDNEHAIGNIPSFIFADVVMIPEFLSIDKVKKQGARKQKIIQYPGVKEGVYLWNMEALATESSLPENPSSKKPRIYIRPEPWTAQYYKGSLNFIDDLLLGLQKHAEVVLLPRGQAQSVHYQSSQFSGIIVQDKPLSLARIAQDCRMFIGAGGTMTREMAVLGIPTISIYQDSLLDVDRYLIQQKQMIHEPHLTAEFALNFLNSCHQAPPSKDLLAKGKEAYELIKSALLNLPEQ